jgi:hypothetical protein
MLDGTVEIGEMPCREKDVAICIRQRGGRLRLIHAAGLPPPAPPFFDLPHAPARMRDSRGPPRFAGWGRVSDNDLSRNAGPPKQPIVFGQYSKPQCALIECCP